MRERGKEGGETRIRGWEGGDRRRKGVSAPSSDISIMMAVINAQVLI